MTVRPESRARRSISRSWPRGAQKSLDSGASYVPFRGSRLEVLRDSFLGDPPAVMIANISRRSVRATHTQHASIRRSRKEISKSGVPDRVVHAEGRTESRRRRSAALTSRHRRRTRLKTKRRCQQNRDRRAPGTTTQRTSAVSRSMRKISSAGHVAREATRARRPHRRHPERRGRHHRRSSRTHRAIDGDGKRDGFLPTWINLDPRWTPT